MSNEGSKITLKLLVDVRSKKVLFAEAEKGFVDFMFTLLTLPLGSVIKLLTAEAMIGSIGNLYQSFNNLSDTYLVKNKETLLHPMVFPSEGFKPLLLGSAEVSPSEGFKPLLFGSAQVFPSETFNPSPFGSAQVTKVAGHSGEGFVIGVITYMITDDLQIKPLSAISSITLIDRFSINKDVQLEEKKVVVGMKEGLALLQASLQSSTVLTDVFLNSSTEKKS